MGGLGLRKISGSPAKYSPEWDTPSNGSHPTIFVRQNASCHALSIIIKVHALKIKTEERNTLSK